MTQTIVNNVYIAKGERDKVDHRPVKPRALLFDTSRSKSMTDWEPDFVLMRDIADTREFRSVDREELVPVVAK